MRDGCDGAGGSDLDVDEVDQNPQPRLVREPDSGRTRRMLRGATIAFGGNIRMRPWLQHLNELEAPLCRAWSRPNLRERVQWPFALISRLGDGVFWYSLIAILPLVDGLDGLRAALHMLITGAAALAIYKSLKGATRRERPCHSLADIPISVAPLDHYSFPSGHTLHAVSFTIVALHYYPQLAWVLVPFTLLVAASRVLLGLHYPSDVAAASGIGLGLAYTGILLVS